MSRDDDVMHDDLMQDEEFADVRAALGLAVPPVAPSPQLKQNLMAAIAETPQLPAEPALAAVAAPVTDA
ncbi:MAG: hypothetical protein LDL15_08525, partial [Yonghaparkia sp.]|nr:hypothetical protein [Microcella sp.]